MQSTLQRKASLNNLALYIGKPWNKGKKGVQIGNNKGKTFSAETRLKMSLAKKGKPSGRKPNLGKHWKVSDVSNMGHSWSEESRKKSSSSHKRRVLEGKCHLWKGGLTAKAMLLRNSLEYKLWRTEVFKRDNWTCTWCGKSGSGLNADHINPFSLYPDLRFKVENGRTLCLECHKTTESFGWKFYNNKHHLLSI